MSQPNRIDRIACFIAGTDTGVGKTHASAALLHAFAQAGWRCAGMKPIASGCEWVEEAAGRGEWRNEDVEQLRMAGTVPVPRQLTCPWLLRTPCSPHLAAQAEGVRIEPSPIERALRELRSRADAVVVEGVGGFRVPLASGPDGWDTADLAVRLALPVVLVVGIRLGCLNHAMLTVEAIRARGLRLAGWIANRIDPGMALADANIDTLKAALGPQQIPLLGVLPWGLPAAEAATGIDFGPIAAACAADSNITETRAASRLVTEQDIAS
ncbi:dethiobiotin synthase [Cupriavidus sp. AU9028]|uniref:dethiobiotin synthase n=1 Tax=Cupriavidus sp. AU9028 TaxID=2871157 RepID=UPI001C954872|nr:dethiobiotin synthase [Cupriavidus sp. AU9028]MBY4896716.1 dethiobiotin synthase [Cupriavidus sp. AU9028]